MRESLNVSQSWVARVQPIAVGLGNRGVQSSLLFAATMAATGFNFLSTIIYTHFVGASGYGDIQFVATVWALLSVCFTLGLFHSGARLLLLESDPAQVRALTATGLLVAGAIGVAIMTVTALLAAPIDLLFESHVAPLIFWLAPLAITLPLRDALVLMLQSLNRITTLAILLVLPNLLSLMTLAVAAQFGALDTMRILLIQQGATVPVILLVIVSLRPRLDIGGKHFAALLRQNRTYGWPIFVGTLSTVASGYLTRMAVYYWADNTAMGYYSLSVSLVEPLKTIPNAAATSSFRSFAGQSKIPRLVLAGTILAAVAALAVAFVLYGKPLNFAYSSRFDVAGAMARLGAIGATLHGFGDFYNRFLGAHGRGRTLRNTAILVGLANVVGFLLLVPLWGAWGAVYASVSAGVIYLLSMLASYRRYRAGLREQPAGLEGRSR